MNIQSSLLVLLAALVAVSAEAGVMLREVTVTESNDEENSGRSVTRMLAEGKAMKTVFEESQNPMMPAGSYMLAPGGDMVYLVDPARKTIMRMDKGRADGQRAG
jgi:hypothetical protein